MDLKDWEEKNEQLADDMVNYKTIYKHRKPCKEWRKNKWCEHYLNARGKKFKNRIIEQLQAIM